MLWPDSIFGFHLLSLRNILEIHFDARIPPQGFRHLPDGFPGRPGRVHSALLVDVTPTEPAGFPVRINAGPDLRNLCAPLTASFHYPGHNATVGGAMEGPRQRNQTDGRAAAQRTRITCAAQRRNRGDRGQGARRSRALRRGDPEGQHFHVEGGGSGPPVRRAEPGERPGPGPG